MAFSSVRALILTCGSLCPEEDVGTCCCWGSLSAAQSPWKGPGPTPRPSGDGFGAPSQASCEQQHPAQLAVPAQFGEGNGISLSRHIFPVPSDGFSHCPRAAAALRGFVLGSISSGVWGDQPCAPSLLPAQLWQSAQHCSQESPGSAPGFSPAGSGAVCEGGRWEFHLEGTAWARAGMQGPAAASWGQEQSVIHSSSRPGRGHVGI